MSRIEWKEEYNLGCEEIDCGHRVFVRIIQKIDEAVEGKMGHAFVARLLNELEKYAVFHFVSEENVMIRKGYPEILKHKIEHEHLLAKMHEVILKIELEREPLEELAEFLMNWFVQHTLSEDRKLTLYLNTGSFM